MARTHEEFLAINDPVGAGTRPPSVDAATTVTPASIVQRFIDQGLVAGFGANTILASCSGFGAANAKASKAAALKQLDIQRRRLEFQQKTGLRDIEHARDKGLRGAINNALQRGIFRSGIREFNVDEVNREQDEAGGDLKTNIALSLEALKAQREGLEAQKFGGGGGGGGDSGLLDIGDLEADSFDLAAAENAAERARVERQQRLIDVNTGPGAPVGTGGVITPIVRPGVPR